jgi:EmrB/QacA subfamily drug resistance transporter
MDDIRQKPAAPAPELAATPPDMKAVLSIFFGILLAMFLSALEQTIVAPALPTIGRALGDSDHLPWIVTAYLLSSTVATPLFGKLSDIYGRRAMMLIAIVIFIVGSLACALSTSMWMLILARALQGLGGGGILPLAQTVVADLLSPRERPMVVAYSSAMFMAACVLGPVLGGVLTDYIHWSLIFWINLPLGALALYSADRALRRLPRNDRPHRLDLTGAALMVAATVVLLLALNWGGLRYAWTSPQILGLVALSVAIWSLFVRRLFTAPEPFIPLGMLKEKVVFGIVVAGFFSIGTIIGLSIFLPMFVELVLGRSPSSAGFVLIALMVGASIGSMIGGRLMTRYVRYKRVPTIGLPFAIVPLLVLGLLSSPDLSLTTLCALCLICGTGLGPMYPSTTVIMQNAVLPHQLGIATGTLNFFRQLGGAIIVAVFGAIALGGLDGGGGHAAGSLAGKVPGAAAADLAGQFRWVFLAGAAFLTVAFVAILLVEEKPLRGPTRRSK